MTHQHAHEHGQTTGDIRVAFLLNLGFALFELVGGLLTNSIAILSDALHDFGDTVSLGLAWLLTRKSEQGSDARYTYGYRRFSLLSAQITSLVLIGGALYVIIESVRRLLSPEPFDERGMILIAIVGIVVNGAAVVRMRRDSGLNAESVSWHLWQDVLGWIAVLVVGIMSLFVDIPILDPLLSLAISLYILIPGVKNLLQTTRLFLLAVPRDVDFAALERQIGAIEGVTRVRHLHLWALDAEHLVLNVRVITTSPVDTNEQQAMKAQVYQIAHEMKLELQYLSVEVESLNAAGASDALNQPDYSENEEKADEAV